MSNLPTKPGLYWASGVDNLIADETNGRQPVCVCEDETGLYVLIIAWECSCRLDKFTDYVPCVENKP